MPSERTKFLNEMIDNNDEQKISDHKKLRDFKKLKDANNICTDKTNDDSIKPETKVVVVISFNYS